MCHSEINFVIIYRQYNLINCILVQCIYVWFLCIKCYRNVMDNVEETPSAESNGDTDEEYLDCGKAVNFTYYDNLVGVARRHRHPNVPEPQVMYFTSCSHSRD